MIGPRRGGGPMMGALLIASLLWAAPPAPPAAPDSPVADAAAQGDLEAVRTLLRGGADVNAAQGDGMTALHWAALQGHVEMAKVLIYAGASLESTTRLGGYTPLHLAGMRAQAGVMAVLLKSGSDVHALTTTGVHPLHLAAASGRPAAVAALLEGGADVNARETHARRTPLMFAVARNGLEAMRVLLKAGADATAATEVVDYAERSRADAEERRRRSRILAAAREPAETPPERVGPAPAREAAQRAPRDTTSSAAPDTARAPRRARPPTEPEYPTPADTARAPASTDPDSPTAPGPARTAARQDPDAPTAPDTAAGPRPMSYDDWVGKQGGMTALHYAAREGRVEAVRMLLDAKVDIDALTRGDRSSPLLVAVINGHYDLAMMLLQRGADPNLASEDGVAPLFATVNSEWALRTWYPQPTAWQQQRTGYLELMEALLKAGADPNARIATHLWYAAYNAGRMGVDYSGATAFWRAAYATDVAAMRLLVAHGADPNIPTLKPAEGRRRGPDPEGGDQPREDPSGLPPVPAGGPAVHPLHAASGVGYGTSRVGQQHRHVADGWLPAVRYLVDSLGVDINLRDHDGYSAVHHAAARGDNATIEYLVSKGADVKFVSRRGQTTVDMANGPQQRVQPFPETIKLLESLGAKNNHKCLSC